MECQRILAFEDFSKYSYSKQEGRKALKLNGLGKYQNRKGGFNFNHETKQEINK